MEYDEQLSVPLHWWVLGVLLVAVVWVTIVVVVPGILPWVVTALVAAAVAASLHSYGSARVQVDGSVLRAGPAQIDLRYLGTAVALDSAASARLAGRDADARAFLVLRPYLHQSVRVDIDDPDDPAPYWQIGTRSPERLASALTAARASG